MQTPGHSDRPSYLSSFSLHILAMESADKIINIIPINIIYMITPSVDQANHQNAKPKYSMLFLSATPQGLEPRLTAPKAAVLQLDDRVIVLAEGIEPPTSWM